MKKGSGKLVHGTAWGYKRYGCKCDLCTVASRERDRDRRRDQPRARTIRVDRKWPWTGYGHNEPSPLTRGECVDGERPCPWAGCKHHLYLDVKHNGAITLNFPHLCVSEIPESCSLDVADRGPVSLATVGRLMNLTRERVRQIEMKAKVLVKPDLVAS